MKIRIPLSWSGFANDIEGMAAVEFALILPLMLVLYFGVVEISEAARASQKVDQISRMLADMTARKLTGGATPDKAAITDDDLEDFFTAARKVIFPLPTAKLRLEIDEIHATDQDRNPHPALVRWIVSSPNTTERRSCTVLNNPEKADRWNEYNTIPESLASTTNRSGYFIAARAQYDFDEGFLAKFFGKSLTLTNWSYAVLRVMPEGTINNPLPLIATKTTFRPEVCKGWW